MPSLVPKIRTFVVRSCPLWYQATARFPSDDAQFGTKQTYVCYLIMATFGTKHGLWLTVWALKVQGRGSLASLTLSWLSMQLTMPIDSSLPMVSACLILHDWGFMV
eukprot:2704354-Rhodomonas_salina.3